jgi:tRNA(adenine34) deaminase
MESDVDRAMMLRCVELANESARRGELPFGSLVADGEKIISEATNENIKAADESRHAEILAIAHARAQRRSLKRCTLYSTIEPCPMCAFCIRAAGISRVVFALRSPLMGGLSRWNILRDTELSQRIPFLFGAPPEIVDGVCAEEVEQTWRTWKPLVGEAVLWLGFFEKPPRAE